MYFKPKHNNTVYQHTRVFLEFNPRGLLYIACAEVPPTLTTVLPGVTEPTPPALVNWLIIENTNTASFLHYIYAICTLHYKYLRLVYLWNLYVFICILHHVCPCVPHTIVSVKTQPIFSFTHCLHVVLMTMKLNWIEFYFLKSCQKGFFR